MARAFSRRRGFHADEGGQMTLLVMSLLLVFAALSAYVLNVAERVHHRTKMQEVADRAAYTAAGTTARGLNYLANGNVALLQITAELAVIDALDPTLRDADHWLDVWDKIITGIQAIPIFGPPIAAVLRAFWFLDKGVVTAIKIANAGLKAVRPVILTARSAVGFAQANAYRCLLMAADRDAGRDAGVDVFAEADVEDAMLRPIEVPPVPPSLPSFLALRRVAASHYGARARSELRRLVDPIASRTSWMFMSQFGWRYPGHADRAHRTRMGEIQVWSLTSEGARADQSFADRHFRRTWLAQAAPPHPMLATIFRGEMVSWRTTSIAEALCFNSRTWDLLTPQWEAALVPVKRRHVDFERPLDALHGVHH